MESIAFAIPLKRDLRQKADELADDLVDGEHARKFDDQSRAFGYRRIKVWAQEAPQAAIIVYLEAEDLEGAMAAQARAGDEFEEWFRGMIKELSGQDPGALTAHRPSKLLHDWHADRGNARAHHAV
jgi:hypothetical protein